MKKKHVVLIVVAILAIAGGAFAYSKRGPKPTEVEVATIGREDIQAKVTANGKVQAKKKVDISATIPGQITLLAVKEGDRDYALPGEAVKPNLAVLAVLREPRFPYAPRAPRSRSKLLA